MVALTRDRALIEFKVGRCTACPKSGCHSQKLFRSWFGSGVAPTVTVTRADLYLGQTVRLFLAPSQLLRLGLTTYGMPLLGLLAGIALGTVVGSELVGLLVGLSGLAGGLLLGRDLQPSVSVGPL